MFAEVPCTGLVVTVNVALVLPEGIVTPNSGTCARSGLLLFSDTLAPPGGAGPFNVTVPIDDDPPTTELGFSVSDLRVGELTLRVVV
jgi:hypothetical protein